MGRKHVLALGLLFLVSGVVASVPALAQPPGGPPQATSSYPTCAKTPTDEESKQAHQRYTAGRLHYDEGDYDNAIKRFKEAYALDCTKHDMLVIISATYEKKGERAEAIKALETYVQRANNTTETLTYTAKIDNLKKELAKQQASSNSTRPSPSASASASASASTSSTVPPPPPPPAPEQGGHTAWPWVVVGVGGAAIVAGSIILATSPKFPEGCSKETEKCTQRPGESTAEFEDRQKRAGDAKGQPTVGIIVLATGGAIAAGGLIWHFLEPTGSKEAAARKTRVVPTVAPGYGGISVSGSFF